MHWSHTFTIAVAYGYVATAVLKLVSLIRQMSHFFSDLCSLLDKSVGMK